MIYFGIPGLIVFLIVFFGVANFVIYKILWDKVNSVNTESERSMVIFDEKQYHQKDESSPRPM